MIAWTDYPFTELGDTEGKPAPIRPVQVMAFDGDKYATVEFEGWLLIVKAGYLYYKPGRLGTVDKVSMDDLLRLPRD